MEDLKLGHHQLQKQLDNFRDIAVQRQASKVIRWMYHFPLIISIAIFISQLFNVGILFSYSCDFTRLYDLLVEYMNSTEIVSEQNGDHEVYVIAGINSERLEVVDRYHEQLWSLFVSEVIELMIPLFNMLVFGWIFFTKGRLHSRIKIIYIVAPALALMLSVSQACMIQISLADRIHHVRFILSKIISPLLEHHPNGSQPIERAFGCQFWDGDELSGKNSTPSCSSVLHDEVVSLTTLHVIIFLHIVPIIVFLYILLRNLVESDAEHLFLYVENVEQRTDEECTPSVSSITTTTNNSTSQLDRTPTFITSTVTTEDEQKSTAANSIEKRKDSSSNHINYAPNKTPQKIHTLTCTKELSDLQTPEAN